MADTRSEQFGRPQQAANVIGAKRRVEFCHYQIQSTNIAADVIEARQRLCTVLPL
jgi:hypothetical protein